MYILNFKNKEMILKYDSKPKRLDVNFQIYTIIGINATLMDDLRNTVMNKKVPSIITTVEKKNSSSFESMSITFPLSIMPIRIEYFEDGDNQIKRSTNIGKIEIYLKAKSDNGEVGNEVSSSSVDIYSNNLNLTYNSDYNIVFPDDYFITSLDSVEESVLEEIDFTCFISDNTIPFCSNFIYREIDQNVFKVIMKSTSYDLVEILTVMGMIEEM